MIDRETVIRLAREAVNSGDGSELSGDAIERFAQLVFMEAALRRAGAAGLLPDPDVVGVPAAPASAQRGIHVECHECHNCGHIGINDSHPTDASCSECDWTGPSPKEDHCPGCGKDGTMHLACPKCSHRYHTIAEATVGVGGTDGS